MKKNKKENIIDLSGDYDTRCEIARSEFELKRTPVLNRYLRYRSYRKGRMYRFLDRMGLIGDLIKDAVVLELDDRRNSPKYRARVVSNLALSELESEGQRDVLSS